MFASSIQLISFSMLTCTIGSRGGRNKMAAAIKLSLASLSKKLDLVIFLDQWLSTANC